MKEFFFFTAITFLTLCSCKKEEVTLATNQTSVQSQLKTSTSSSLLQKNETNSEGAVTFSSVEIIHEDGSHIFNPCTNETMTLYGDAQLRTHGVTNNNTSITTLNESTRGIKAIGESGTVYRVAASGHLEWSNYSNGVFTFKLRFANRFFTEGSSNNFIEKGTFYLKVDADGNTSYIIDPSFESYCQ